MKQPSKDSSIRPTVGKNNLSLVILISGYGSNLDAVINAINEKKIPNTLIQAVISNRPDAFGLTRAKQRDIPTHCVDHTHFRDRDSFDAALIEKIQQFKPDLVVLAGFMRILTPKFVREFKGKLLNVHPSLLPKYKGLNTHQRAIDAGDREHGCSIHFVTEALDGGPIVAQAVVNIDPEDTPESLAVKVRIEEHKLFPLCIQWFAQNRLEMIGEQATFDGKLITPPGKRLTHNELDQQQALGNP